MVSKIWKFVKIIFWPILFLIGQLFICYLLMMFYMFKHPEFNLDDPNSNSILLEFINSQSLLIVLLECITLIPIFYLIYKKYRMDRVDCSVKLLLRISFISFLLSGILNIIIITIKNFMAIELNSSVTFSIIIATGIIGPILEELLFRGIVYGGFLHIFKEKIAFYLSILVFAISHVGDLSQVLFAIIIGYYLTYLYNKYHDIRISMIAHIIVNITSILITPIILLLF